MYDVMTNVADTTINCLDKGFVKLIDVMPRLVPDDQKTADYAIVQAARVSYGDGTKTVNEDRGLVRYLLRHQHTTPLEMIVFKFGCKMPIYIARQWIRHRASSYNEVSGRYSVLKDEFHIPALDDLRQQSKVNKQGGTEKIDNEIAEDFVDYTEKLCDESYQKYLSALEDGISREQARTILPLNLYTEWFWKIDLHNLLHFLALRCDSHAQKEIQVYGNAILKLIQPIVPFAIEAWEDYHPMRGAIKLTRLEVEAINKLLSENINLPKINTDNKREQAEWEEKARKLGFK